MRFNSILNNFSSGEWSPKMHARTDADQYKNACATLKNTIPRISGGAYRRQGTQYISLEEVDRAELSTNTIMIPYNISNVSSSPGNRYFILMANNTTISDWFVYDTEDASTSSITSTPSTSVAPVNLHIIQVGDFLWLVDRTGVQEPYLFYFDGSVFRIETLWGYVSGTTPGVTKIWRLYPFLEIQSGTSPTMTSSHATGTSRTLTSSAAFFTSDHVGALFKLTDGTTTGAVKIVGFTNSTTVTTDILATVPTSAVGAAAGTSWEESAWSNERGWPRSITAFQGRMIYGGNATLPDTIWGSRIGNVFDMMQVPFTGDDEFTGFATNNALPFDLEPSSNEASHIKALTSGKALFILSDKYEISAYGTQGALGKVDVNFESASSFGAENIQPIRVNNYVTYVQAGGLGLRDIAFNFDESQYKSADLSFIADHLFIREDEDGRESDVVISKLAATRKSCVLWILLGNSSSFIDRKLFGLTLDRDYQVNGYFQFETEGEVVNMVSAGVAFDDLYLIVKRTVNGVSKFYLEKLLLTTFENTTFTTPEHSDYGTNFCPTYADCWLKAGDFLSPGDGTPPNDPSDDWNDFAHLAGNTVQVIGDGQYLGEYEVTSAGHIILESPVQTIFAGLKYTTEILTLPIELGQQVPGTSQGLIKRIDDITVKFYKSYGAQYGADEDNLFDIDFKDVDLNPNDPPRMYTGAQLVNNAGNYAPSVQVMVRQDKPWPCNVLVIIARGQTYD